MQPNPQTKNLINSKSNKRLSMSDGETIFLENVKKGADEGIIILPDDQAKITYHCSRDFTTSFKNPEEKVRASYFVELVEDYGYPKERIDFEVKIPRRTPEDRGDIVIYEDDELKKPYLVVECKKDGVTDAEFKQAIEQAFGNANSLRAKLATVVAGTTRTAFNVAEFKPSERDKNVISDIPKKYGKIPKYRFIKGKAGSDLKIVPREDLISALEKAHDTVWQGGRLAPTTAFDEVAKLLFCKLQDEKQDTRKDQPYNFQIGTHEKAEDVFKRIDEIYQRAKKKDAEVFRDNIRLEPKIVYSVVEHLQSINFSRTDLDTKGIAFERFMEDFFRGKMGQFFTPREVIRFCVEMLKPGHDELILDPACGSGGFLLNAMDYVRQYAEENYDEREAWEIWHNFAMKNLYGIEINDQIARVCKMNMIIHDDGHTNVISSDALQDIKDIKTIHKSFKAKGFDIILTNPPFGASVKSTEHDYLGNFTLGKVGKKERNSQKTEILFIERCLDFLRPDGRMAIVLPDGILTNSSLQYVRDFLMEKAQILAVVSLPQFAFAHFGAGVKSSLVFLKKKRDNETKQDYPIFMAIADHIGYDATGRKDPIDNFKEIYPEFNNFIEAPNKFNAEGKRPFLVNLSKIRKRLDPLYYSEDLFEFLDRSKYKVTTIREVTTLVKSGFAAGSNQQTTQDKGIIQIRPTNISEDGFLKFDNNIYVPKKNLIKKKDLVVKKGDVLFNNTNSQEQVGKTAFVNIEGEYFCSNHVTIIRCEKDVLLPEYLWLLLNAYQRKKIFFSICTNWNNQSGVNTNLLKTIKIPLPDLKEQQKIVDDYTAKMTEAKKKEREISELLKQAKTDFEKIVFGL